MKNLIFLAFGWLVLSVGPLFAQTWDMPVGYPDSNYHTKLAKKFAESVEKATNGKIKITVHSNGSLFKGNEIKRAVQRGQAQIGERLLSAHANEEPIFEIDSLPFLATSFEDSAKLWKVAKPKYEKVMDKQGLVMLYSIPWPPQGLYADKELNRVDDMKGLKLRSYNATISRIANMAGASPLQIEAAELSQALATGVVDSFVSSGSTGYDIKAWENLDYFYEVNAWLPRNFVFVNKSVWTKLDAKTQKAILEQADIIEKEGIAEAETLTKWYLSQFTENGMNVLQPSEELKTGLSDIGKQIVDDWLKKVGKDGQEVLDEFNK